MRFLRTGAVLIEFQQIAVRIVKEEHMPFAFTCKPDWGRYEFHASFLKPFVDRWQIVDAETKVGTGDLMNGASLLGASS